MHIEVSFSIDRRCQVKITKEIRRDDFFMCRPLIELTGWIRPEDLNKFEKVKEVAKAIDALSEILRKQADNWIQIIDDLSTDLWGGAGPDCRTMPA